MLKERYPYYLANRPQQPNAGLEVTNKYTGEVATRVALADAKVLDAAIAAATEAAPAMRRLATWQRKAVLQHLAKRVRERHEEMSEGLTIEAGKPVKYARGEVDRLIDTVEIAAEESTRIYGEVMPLDISQRSDGYRGMWKRVPVGPCSFITPWNFPLNLVAHKLAPALACGCPFVLKPATTTPIGALILGEILAETDLPPGAFSILPMDTKDADALVEDTRLKKLSFTGSPAVGWNLRDRAKKKFITLELGGNAATIIDRDADIEDAIERNIFGGVASGPVAFNAIIIDTTISNNHADVGGGLLLAGRDVIIQCTVMLNTAVVGGGAYLVGGSFTLPTYVTYSTFAYNSATGAGEAIYLPSGELVLHHSIVAASSINVGDITVVTGASLLSRYSLIGNGAGSGLAPAPVGAPDSEGNLVGGLGGNIINPQLGSPKYRGGPVLPGGYHFLTLEPIATSPAVNAGDPDATPHQNGVPSTDQRGSVFTRVYGRIDIGAIERQPNQLPGDYNFDWIVDSLDYTVWRNTLHSDIQLQADGNEDGQINEADFDIWKQHYGETYPPNDGGGGLATLLADESESQTQPPAKPGAAAPVSPIALTPLSIRQPPARPGVRPVVRPTTSIATAHDDALLAWLSNRDDTQHLDDIDLHIDVNTEDSECDNPDPFLSAFALLK